MRSDLHSHTGVHALQRHADPRIRPERRRNPAAPSRCRRNGVLGFAATARFSGSGPAKLRLLDHPPWRPNWESSWKTARSRMESARKRCQWSTLLKRAVFAQRVGLGGPRQLSAKSGCRQRTKGEPNEATVSHRAAARIAQPDHQRVPSRNRPGGTAGPRHPRRRHLTREKFVKGGLCCPPALSHTCQRRQRIYSQVAHTLDAEASLTLRAGAKGHAR
jgi:hypothetical protein